ncbi:unnamed protein product, partial [Candidula unifasciata]
QVLDSDYRRKKRMSGRHIPIGTWLDALHLTEYTHLFHQYGGVEDLLYTTESEIKELGIRNGGHRAKIISSLRILKDKYEKGRVSGSGDVSTQRTPTPSSPTTPVPDFVPPAVSPGQLQADLQNELAGDPSELRSCPWYHGNISRQRAEAIIVNNGDFLVRDCISKPGDFVLTCRWKGVPLNFMINSIVGDCKSGNVPTVSYQFEDDSFPTIQQLINYYRHFSKQVTVLSGAIINNPVSRSMPLSYYDTKYGALINFAAGTYATPNQIPKPSPHITSTESPSSSPQMNRHKNRWAGSQPVLNIAGASEHTNSARKRESRSSSLERCDSLPMINVTPPVGHPAAESPHYTDENKLPKPSIAHMRAGSVPTLVPDNLSNGREAPKYLTLGRRKLVTAGSESELSNRPPPKPSRIPSIKYKEKPTVVVRKFLYDDDRDYSDYTQVKEEPSWLHGSVESIPAFQEVTLRRSTPSPPTNHHQKGRRANLVHRERIFIPSQSSEQKTPNLNTQVSSGSTPNLNTQVSSSSTANLNTQVSSGPEDFIKDIENSRVPPVHPVYADDVASPPSNTYQIVARSRSFRSPGQQGNQDNENVTNKAYKTLPNRSSQVKSRDRIIHNAQLTPTQRNADYDYPKAHVTDDSDILGFHDMEYMTTRTITKPPKINQSIIAPATFRSSFLPKGHKVLDQTVLLNVKALILNKTPRSIALHLTKYDLFLMNVTEERDLGLGVLSGLELFTLPQGKQMRQDAIERWDSLRMFTIVTLLTSPTVNERARILNLWIQTCLELRTTAGNLYSFAAVMSALTSPQIIRLTDTWLILRQNYTSSAYVFDTKLRPGYVSLNDATSHLPLNNISVPYVTPVCQLLERDVESIFQEYYWEKGLDAIGSSIDVLLTHLDTARIIASQGNLYQVTGRAIMTTLTHDPELYQVLCPEFHLLVLWGEKGWMANRRERLDKMEQILSLLSQKYQPPDDDGTAV